MSFVTDYIKERPPAEKAFFNNLRNAVRKIIPDAEETISYGIPSFKYRGKYLIAFAAHKNFVSIYPGGSVGDVLHDELKAYQTGRGTFSCQTNDPIPNETLEKIVIFCKDSVDQRIKSK